MEPANLVIQTNRTPGVGVAILIRRSDEVLLLLRHNAHGAGTWAPPGGHLDFGESPEACAIREAREETGLAVQSARFLALTNDVFAAEGRHYITLWMEAEAFTGEPRVNAPEESVEVGWFPWDALPETLFLPFRNLLDGLCYPPQAAPPGKFE